MRHRRRDYTAPVPVHIDSLPHGGHDLEQIPDNEDDADYTYVCARCHCVVSGWELDEGVWPARIGRYCTALLLEATR